MRAILDQRLFLFSFDLLRGASTLAFFFISFFSMPRKKPVDYERVRGSRACAFCSRRKIKCDGCEPCSACKSRKTDCIYVQGKKRGPPSKHERQHRQQQQQQRREAPESSNDISSSYADSTISAVSDQDDGEVGDNGPAVVKRARFEQETPQPTALDELATLAYHSRSNTPGGNIDPTCFTSFALASATSDQGSCSTRTSMSHRELESLFALPVSAEPLVLQGNHAIPDTRKDSANVARLADLDDPLGELSNQVIDQLLTIYQSFVHLHWPIIYLPSLSSLRVLANTRPLLYHAVLAVAASTWDNLNPHSPATALPDPTSPAETSKGASAVCPPGTAAKLVKYLQIRLQEQELAPTLETIQVLILLALVEMGGGETSYAYIHASMACVFAVDLGLHRHQSESQFSHHSRPEERRRVLWGCYVLDKTLAAALERPMMLHSDDIDVDLPSIEERDEYDIFVNDRSSLFIAPDRVATMADVKCRCLSSFGANCKLMMLLEKILAQVYSPKAKRNRQRGDVASYKQAVVQLDAELRSWRKDLPAHLRWSDETLAHSFVLKAPHSSGTDSRRGSTDAVEGGLCDTGDGFESEQISNTGRRLGKSVERSRARPETDINVPPQVLTMRAWYAACLLLLHRPRIALDDNTPSICPTSPSASSCVDPQHTISLATQAASQQESQDKPAPRGQRQRKQATGGKGDTTFFAMSGSELVRWAASQICYLLPQYRATFSVRRIPSSWIYLIFQSAIIHSTFLDNTGAQAAKGNSANESEHLFRQCIRNLEQMALTWKGASHHVETLRRLAGFHVTRPSTPVLTPATLVGQVEPLDATSSAPQACDTGDLRVSALLDPALPSGLANDSDAGIDWLNFWSQMPSSSEDVWLWNQFIETFGNSTV